MLLLPVPALADATPSVLVQTQQPRTGSLPDLITAYGSAAPAGNASLALSLQQDGFVSALLVTPGEAVKAGQDLIDFTPSASATSAYQQAVSALAVAQEQRDHAARLLAQQLATRDQLAQADKAVSDAQASLDALRREGAGAASQRMKAPFDGVVATVAVAQGDHVQPGAVLMTLARADGLVVTVGVEPEARAKVRPGDDVALTALSGGGAIAGRVQRIDAILNPKTRQIDVDVAVPVNSTIAGEAFRANITTGQLTGWLVPHDAVLNDDKGAYVFQVAGGKAARVRVRWLGGDGAQDVVDGPIDPSRPLVTSGNYQLDDGAAVREDTGLASSR